MADDPPSSGDDTEREPAGATPRAPVQLDFDEGRSAGPRPAFRTEEIDFDQGRPDPPPPRFALSPEQIDAAARQDLAGQILSLFRTANYLVMGFVVAATIADYVGIYINPCSAGERLVSESVLMAVIGATTVQLGSVMIAIAFYYFKKPRSVR